MGMRLTRLTRSLRRPGRAVELLVDPAGVVPCPLRGDVSLETCLACAQLSDVRGAPAAGIRCEVPGRVPAAATHPGF